MLSQFADFLNVFGRLMIAIAVPAPTGSVAATTGTISCAVDTTAAVTSDPKVILLGHKRLQLFDQVDPPLRKLVPTLPRTDVAHTLHCTLPYTGVAYFVWPMMVTKQATIQAFMVDAIVLLSLTIKAPRIY